MSKAASHSKLLSEAVILHQSGKLSEAETLYNHILAKEPSHADCLHLIGLIAHQTGQNEKAAELIKKAIIANKNVDQFHYHLGTVLLALNRGDEAADSYRRSIALNPRNAEAHNNLGFIYRLSGKYEDAAKHFKLAIKINPNYADAHNNLGLTLKEQGDAEGAIKYYLQALQIKPQYAEANNNMGIALRTIRRFDEALEYFKHSLEINPNHAETYNNFGNLLRDQQKFTVAEECFAKALKLKPDFSEAYSNLGNIMKDQGRLDDAIALYQRTIDAKPDFAEAHYNLGTVLPDANRREEAITHFERAIALKPDYADAHWNEAHVLLSMGYYAEGWREYEWRWRKSGGHPNEFANFPLWDGKPLNGKTILLHSEQGLGDSIQFVRYVDLVKERGGRTLILCPPTLCDIFSAMKNADQVIPIGKNIPDFDCQCPLMSLPFIFETTLETIPNSVPYLTPSHDRTEYWNKRLQAYSGLKVGLVWAGSPRKDQPDANAIDRRRSMNLNQFALLADIKGAHFISLQLGEPAEQIKNPPQGMEIIDFTADLKNYSDTAALISNLDLVIGVDTSVIHMAGALAKPVWVLSRYDACWRWLLNRNDSPWYPTLRLFNQHKSGDWDTVMKDVSQQLKTYSTY